MVSCTLFCHLTVSDSLRFGRLLRLYYAQIEIGTPSKSYYVQVDTGSDILWVNCIQCKHCPSHSDLGVRSISSLPLQMNPLDTDELQFSILDFPQLDLTLYDPKSSDSGYVVTCDQEFCTSTYGEVQGCRPQQLCMYSILYGDGSGTNGYFVTDNLHYSQVTGDHQIRQVNASITFGLVPVYLLYFITFLVSSLEQVNRDDKSEIYKDKNKINLCWTMH